MGVSFSSLPFQHTVPGSSPGRCAWALGIQAAGTGGCGPVLSLQRTSPDSEPGTLTHQGFNAGLTRVLPGGLGAGRSHPLARIPAQPGFLTPPALGKRCSDSLSAASSPPRPGSSAEPGEPSLDAHRSSLPGRGFRPRDRGTSL